MTESSRDTLISIRDLKVHFGSGGGVFAKRSAVRAVDGVSLDIVKGETLGLVGESGCGKSTLGKAILRLVEATSGKVIHGGVDVSDLGASALREKRKHLQMIFQDPYASLDPRMTVGQIVAEPLRTFGIVTKDETEKRVTELLEAVGLNAAFSRRYPHEFSGGQRQRIGIARALAAEPEFIVADEPVSALDVSIQAQILNLLRSIQRSRGLTYLFISHDLRAVRHVADRIAVMYLGKIVEIGDAKSVYENPMMPYTRALISAVPVPDPVIEAKRERIILKGDVPSPTDPPSGCRFRTRCPIAVEECGSKEPELREIADGRFVACGRV